MDLVSTIAANSTISWGPYILLALGAVGVVTWYSFRRIISRIDTFGEVQAQQTVDIAVLKDRQLLTATKVGVSDKQLKEAGLPTE